MKRWARLDGNRNVITAFDGVDDKNVYTDIAHLLVEVAADVRDNDLVDEMGNKAARPVLDRFLPTEDFLERFTAGEFNAIMGNPTARNFIVRKIMTRVGEGVNLDGNGIGAFLDTLVSAGFITAQRKTEILS